MSSMNEQRRPLKTEEETRTLARELAKVFRPGMRVDLQGEMGAGKTTFVRYLADALGAKEQVQSPTYTLVQEYPINGGILLHADLYRLGGAESVWEDLDFQAYLNNPKYLVCIEWPQRLAGTVSAPNYVLCIDWDLVTDERVATLKQCKSLVGEDQI